VVSDAICGVMIQVACHCKVKPQYVRHVFPLSRTVYIDVFAIFQLLCHGDHTISVAREADLLIFSLYVLLFEIFYYIFLWPFFTWLIFGRGTHLELSFVVFVALIS
jgi:hypothetical protein